MTKEEKFQDTFKSRVYNWLSYHFGYQCEYCHTPYMSSKAAFQCCADKRRAKVPHMGDAAAFLPYDFWIEEAKGNNSYTRRHGDGPIYRMPTRICPVCNGTKRHNGVTCDRCDGMGKVY